MDENIIVAIGILSHQVICPGGKCHLAPIGADTQERVGGVICLGACAGDGYALGGARLPVMDKNVAEAVCVAAHQVARFRDEGNVTPVSGDHR